MNCLVEVRSFMAAGAVQKGMEGHTDHQRMVVAIMPTGGIGAKGLSWKHPFLFRLFYQFGTLGSQS